MRLWVDGQSLQTDSRYRGIGRYVVELISELVRSHSDIDLHVSLNAEMVDEAIVARSWLETILEPSKIHLWHGLAGQGEARVGYTLSRRMSELALVHHVNCLCPDVAISLSPFEGQLDASVPLLPNNDLMMPLFAIFYDAIPYVFANKYLSTENESRTYMRRFHAHKDFDALVCISEFAKLEAERIFPNVPALNIAAGISRSFEEILADSSLNAYSSDPYILYVGALDWRKNVDIIPRAISRLESDVAEKVSLLLVGDHPHGNLDRIKSNWESLGLRADRLTTLGIVSDRELAELYKGAITLIQPSRMEGFGLTALEALAIGCPVLAADRGALPEVVGVPELLFDPDDAKHLSKLISSAIQSDVIKQSIQSRSIAVQREFSWTKSASTLVSYIKSRISVASSQDQVDRSRSKIVSAASPEVFREDGAINLFALAEPVSSSEPRLIVDATSTVRHQYRTGIQRVVRNICRELQVYTDRLGIQTHIAFCDDNDGWFATDASLPPEPIRSAARSLQPCENDIWLMLDSSWDMVQFHSATLEEARLRGAKVYSCVYDTIPLLQSGFCSPPLPPVFRTWFNNALSISTGFICISSAVADEIRKILTSIECPRSIGVAHWRLGADFSQADNGGLPRVENSQEDYHFLMVGTIEPRKGHLTVLDAFDRHWQSGGKSNLTIVGQFGWEAKHIANEITQHREFGRKLNWHQHVSDEKLAEFYAHSDALISASFGEGFGLPIVEAAHFGVRIIASDLPVFREVSRSSRQPTFFPVGDSVALEQIVSAMSASPKSKSTGDFQGLVWPTWRESAEELAQILIEDEMPYYIPKEVGMPLSAGGWKTAGTRALSVDESRHQLELINQPALSDDGSLIVLRVKIANQSKTSWFGQGVDGRFGVALTFSLENLDGSIFRLENDRSTVGLVLPPGESQILRVDIQVADVLAGAGLARIEMVQEGVRRWGNPLLVELSDLREQLINRDGVNDTEQTKLVC